MPPLNPSVSIVLSEQRYTLLIETQALPVLKLESWKNQPVQLRACKYISKFRSHEIIITMTIIIIIIIAEQCVHLTWTLKMDSGHKNKNIGFYPKSLRPFLRILCVVDDSIYACWRNFSSALRGCLRQTHSHLLILIKSLFILNKLNNIYS